MNPATATELTGVYFFVSYARVPPVEGGGGGPDSLVRSFFGDLSRRVKALARVDTPLGVGLYDGSRDIGADLDAGVSRALGTAEVLVPLYSPRYVRPNSWPMGERLAFQQRLSAVARDTTGHIQPVLWMPLPGGATPPSDGVQNLATDIPDYGELGLGALCDLAQDQRDRRSQYRRAYEMIVDRLAGRIVAIAERSPIGPGTADPSTDRSTPTPQSAAFVVAVLAPTTSTLPRGRRADGYGTTAADWSPFVQARPVPIARQAANVAERLELETSVVDLLGLDDELGGRPTVLLIDPWLLANDGGADRVAGAVGGLPEWVTPMVVADEHDAQYAGRGAELHQQAVAMLDAARGRGNAASIYRPEQFENAMPGVVTFARKLFLRRMKSIYPPRPRLADPPPPDVSEGD